MRGFNHATKPDTSTPIFSGEDASYSSTLDGDTAAMSATTTNRVASSAKVGIDDYLVRFPINERGSVLHELMAHATEIAEVAPDELNFKRPAKQMDGATVAAEIVNTARDENGKLKLRMWRGEYWRYSNGCFAPIANDEVRAEIVRHVNEGYRNAGTNHIAAVEMQVKAATIVPASDAPMWLSKQPAEWSPGNLLIARNGIVNLPKLVNGDDDYLRPNTPDLFTTVSLDFAFNTNAPAPERWLQFIDQLWPDDPQSVALLQTWFGYCLTADTRQQKLLMLVGPKRSGKSTIVRILQSLLGIKNVASPTLASLGERFGLSSLVGKSLATITDARLSGRTDSAVVVERLLSITGEDSIDVDRKHRDLLTVKLPTRIFVVSNEMPKLTDASGALTGRMLLLCVERSFFGQENIELTDQLREELPGILLWAIEGWAQLQQQRRFVQPDRWRAHLEDMEDLASPIGAFVRECCQLAPNYEVAVPTIYSAYQSWCQETGRHPVSQQLFGRDLHAITGSIACSQRTNHEIGKRVRIYQGITIKQ